MLREHDDIVPHELARKTARDKFLAALKRRCAFPELALGQRPDCTIEEFRQHAHSLRNESQLNRRATVDLLASFGAEVGGDVWRANRPDAVLFHYWQRASMVPRHCTRTHGCRDANRS